MKLLNKFYPYLTALIVFIIYMFTLAPSVIQIDAGELATVQYTLGIAHPTGYPLFTILGFIFLHIPFGISTITQANLLAAIYCAAASGVFAYTFRIILDNTIFIKQTVQKIKRDKIKKAKKDFEVRQNQNVVDESNHYNFILASLAAFALAFSRTFWFQSTSIEVYSLHLLLLSLIILSLIKIFYDVETERYLTKNTIFFAAALALGFTNHMTTLLVIPAATYIYFLKFKFNKNSIIRIGYMLLIFIPILIILYAYLPLRASAHPMVNWGNPIDMERILRHISGKQYQVWIFSSTEAAKKQLAYFFNILPGEYTVSFLFIIIGLFTSFLKARKLFIFFIILFISTVLYSINYDINDIDSYFLLAFVSLGFFVLFGIKSLIQLFKQNNINYTTSLSIVAIIIVIQSYINFNKVDQSGIYVYEDYTKEILTSVPKNSIILSYLWDYFVSPSYYFQNVEGLRKDVNVIDKELLRRSWYYTQLSAHNSKILEGIKSEKEQFLEALKPFERSEAFDSQLLENLYRTIMTKIISTNINEHEFFITTELFENEMQRGEFSLPQGYTLVPDLFMFKVVKNDGQYVPATNPNFSIRYKTEEDGYSETIKKMVSTMLIRRAMYEKSFNKNDRAKLYVDKVKKDFPDALIPNELNSL
ncbi:MAG TPA: DUF2723 domain-containing protein [Ignavibacteriaceae bacterium]|nr:DUF2723 domain-containing protein [Ignavibacteriaceae bacterium]